jgi:RNA polymerase sigma factor (sigma-70 family)
MSRCRPILKGRPRLAKTIRLTARLWAEHVRQVRLRNCRRLNESRRRRKRETLIVEHMVNVRGIAATVRHMFPSIPFDDLVSCGYVGLCDAAGRYDPSRGKFAPYAYQRIRGAIIDAHKRRAYKEELHDSLDEMQGAIRTQGGVINNETRHQLLTADPRPLQDALCFDHERMALARAAAVLLPDEERAVLEEALAGLQLAQIAAECGKSVSWVRVRLASGKKHLALMLASKLAA